MKKKIALFMAAIMSLTTVPAFGANTLSVVPLGQAANKKEGVYDGSSVAKGISHFVDIVLDESVESGSQFRAELVGATFAGVEKGTNDFISYFESVDEDKVGDARIYLSGWLAGAESVVVDGETRYYADFDDTGVWSVRSTPAPITGGTGTTTPPTATEIKDAQATVDSLKVEYAKLAADSKTVMTEKLLLEEALPYGTALATNPHLTATTVNGVVTYVAKYTKIKLQEMIAVKEADLVVIDNAMVKIVADIAKLETEFGKDNINETLPTVTTGSAITTVLGFDIANAGTTTNAKGQSRTVWSNMAYSGNKGDSVESGVVYVKKTGDSTITVTIMEDIVVSKTADKVIRLPLPIEINDDAESVEFNVTNGGGFLSKKQFMLVDTTGGGTTTTSDNATGREIITLEDIRIEENAVGLLATTPAGSEGTAFELTAPDGYRFKNRLNQVMLDTDPDAYFKITQDKGNSKYNYTTTGTFHSLVEDKDIMWTDDEDQTSFVVLVNVEKASQTLTSAILVQGLVIEPLDDDAIVDGEELFMEIEQYEESAATSTGRRKAFQDYRTTSNAITAMDVTEEEFKVATSVDWAVTLTPEEVVTLEAGRWAADVDDDFHATAELTLIETEKGGWLADRTTTFTLPEGVEIRGFKVTGVDALATGATGTTEFDEFFEKAIDLGMWEGTSSNDYNVRNTEDFSQGKVSIDENTMSWKNLDIDATDITEINFELYLSIAPTFEGDEIAIELGGTAIIDEVEPVVVAEVLHPITVTTKVTDVQIGYQKFSVADIIIQENFAGAILEEEDGLVVSMDNDKAEGLEIRGYDTMTIEGDLKLDDDAAKDYTNQIVFDVVRASKTASTITLKGVEVYVDRTVPYGVYDVSVLGESVFANQNGGSAPNKDYTDVDADNDGQNDDDYVFARFGDAYTAAYVNLATEGSYTPLKSHVVISEGNPVVIVDGVEKTMTDVVPYRTTAEGASFMVPVRFASEVFGVETKDTLWDDASGTFTLFTGGKTIQFVKNADFYRINGVEVKMMTGDVVVKSEVDPATSRMYIPFRHLGRAFGIADADITYNETTGTAEYNQPRVN